jgi:DNA-binding MarR family transcriptional regulator
MAKTIETPLTQAYMRFLRLAKAIEGDKTTPSLDANERALLEALALSWHAGAPMTVMQAMALKELGSPATMHRRISRLRKLGMIEPQEDLHDTRIKRLVLTSTAQEYFAQLGQTLQLAMST